MCFFIYKNAPQTNSFRLIYRLVHKYLYDDAIGVILPLHAIMVYFKSNNQNVIELQTFILNPRDLTKVLH